MNGVAMEIAGTSSPSSGSEHLISHAMDSILGKDNYPHGIQVGVATYIISKIQNHKVKEINDFFKLTGFWDFVKTLNIKKSVICEAIDKAPSIKKYRATVIHNEENRVQAKFIVNNDELLNKILVQYMSGQVNIMANYAKNIPIKGEEEIVIANKEYQIFL